MKKAKATAQRPATAVTRRRASTATRDSVPSWVLLVDDEPTMLRSIIRLLGSTWKVETADSAEQALALLESRPFAAVITDYEMPGQNGLWLLDQVQKRRPDTKRLLHTAHNPTELDEHVRSGVVQRFLPKPVQLSELVDSLAKDEE